MGLMRMRITRVRSVNLIYFKKNCTLITSLPGLRIFSKQSNYGGVSESTLFAFTVHKVPGKKKIDKDLNSLNICTYVPCIINILFIEGRR